MQKKTYFHCPVHQGGYKLKIPTLLLKEKEKTRQRFTQARCLHACTSQPLTRPLSSTLTEILFYASR